MFSNYIENQLNFKSLKLPCNETIRARTLNLKVEGPFIIHYRRKRHHGWRRRPTSEENFEKYAL